MDNGQRHPRDLSTKEPAATKTLGAPILPRVLFACDGWPSGMIDLASWIDRRGLAETVVFQFQPGRLFRLEPELGEAIQSGFADDHLREAFQDRGFPLNEGAYLSETGPGEWRVQDRALGTDFQIADDGEGFDVLSSPPPPALPREAFFDLGEAFVRKLQSFQPHVVGFRVEGADIEVIRRRVEAVRRFVDAEIVLGGPTATSHPRHTLEATGADYVFAHETEESFALFLDWARRDNAFRHAVSVPGLTYAYAGTVYVNEPPRDGYGVPLRAVNTPPRPAPSVQILRENRLNWGLLENFSTESDGLYFTGGRGCPGECTFCAQLHGRRVRSKTADQLLEEITGADRLVRRGRLQVSRWPLFEHTNRPDLQPLEVAWASIYDEDFFLDRRRAVEFFRLWDATDLKACYRLGFQTNPRSLLNSDGRFDPELLEWIGRLSPMIQLGAESFHCEVLRRWRKRHTIRQLETVLDALDMTGQDYGAFILWTDFETTVEELLDSLWLLARAAWRHPRMRIASSPYTIPLYESDVRRRLEFRSDFTPPPTGMLATGTLATGPLATGPLATGPLASGTPAKRAMRDPAFSVWDFERPQPGWMDPFVAELADLIDESFQHALNLPTRDAAILEAADRVRRRVKERVEERVKERAEETGRSDWVALAEWMYDDVTAHRIDAHLGR